MDILVLILFVGLMVLSYKVDKRDLEVRRRATDQHSRLAVIKRLYGR
jgi:hypothetical protein